MRPHHDRPIRTHHLRRQPDHAGGLQGGQVLAHQILPFTQRGTACQRLAKSEIEREVGHEIERGGVRLFCSRLDREIGTRAVFSLRSRDPLLAVAPPGPTSARNVLAGTIRSIEADGPGRRVTVQTPHPLRVNVTPSAVEELELVPGKRVYLLIKASALRCLT